MNLIRSYDISSIDDDARAFAVNDKYLFILGLQNNAITKLDKSFNIIQTLDTTLIGADVRGFIVTDRYFYTVNIFIFFLRVKIRLLNLT